MVLRKRKGFTLIEILLVVIMVGILASMALLSGGDATAQTKAAGIVNDLRQLRAAALLFYAASIDAKTADFGNAIKTTNSIVTYLGKYLSNVEQFKNDDGEEVWKFWSNNGKNWYVARNVDDLDDDLRTALETQAKSAGLVDFSSSGPGDQFTKDASGGFVAMKVR